MSMDMGDKSSMANSEAVATDKVSIDNFEFVPRVITVKKGTKITWTNNDSVAHSVTADEASGPDSKLLGNQESFSHTYVKAGTYTYHCQPHQYMKGTVIVTD
jgi:plastocyanin